MKAVLTLHALDLQDRSVLRTNLRRAQWLPFFKKLPPTEIALEARGSGHRWARGLTALGQAVHPIPPEAKEMFVLLGQQIEDLDARIKEIMANDPGTAEAKSSSRRSRNMRACRGFSAIDIERLRSYIRDHKTHSLFYMRP